MRLTPQRTPSPILAPPALAGVLALQPPVLLVLD